MQPIATDPRERLREIDAQIAALQAEASEIRLANGMGSLRMLSLGGDKIGAIKAARALLGIGLFDAKYLVEHLPQILGDYTETHPAVKQMKAAGATFDYVDEPAPDRPKAESK